MRVWGTAGHVDHGKSTLVKALTGINPDRLKEEQVREMTIELGFAWMILPNGDEVGIVDVPGHRDFIENMLAGVGGIDAALFVIAADEGVMPQTREHLAILDILQVQAGVIAITKSDLAENSEWMDLVEEDIRNIVFGTVLEKAPIVRVSARNGVGLDNLRIAMMECVKNTPFRVDYGRPRLPIDRVFSMPGFGTIVTGTLLDGELRVGDTVEILPGSIKSRIRGLQGHQKKTDLAQPGSRTAVNITGIEVEQISRGNLLVHPNTYQTTQLIDVHFKMVKDASKPLKHNSEIKFFLGADEILARTRVLGVEYLLPDQEGWLQLELQRPVAVVKGDHYILRRPSPGETLGGGQVVDPQPKKRHKRFDPGVIQRLEILRAGSDSEILLQTCASMGIARINDIRNRSRLSTNQFQHALQELDEKGDIVVLGRTEKDTNIDACVLTLTKWEAEKKALFRELEVFHEGYPLRKGMPREELKSRLRWPTQFFIYAIEKLVQLKEIGETPKEIFRGGFSVTLDSRQKIKRDELLRRFSQNPYSPPSVKECQEEIGEELFSVLLDRQDLIKVSEDVVFRKSDYDGMLKIVRETITLEGGMTVAQFRDRFVTSRRYALAFLEYLDMVGITRREGDSRILKNPKKE